MNIIQFVFRWLPDFLYFRELNLMKQHWLFYKWVKYHFGWAQMTIDYEKVTPPLRPSENLDFLRFITVLMAYKAL